MSEPLTHAPCRRRPRVLLLTHRLPYPPDRGDRVRKTAFLNTLAHCSDLSIACVCDERVHDARQYRRHVEHLAALTDRLAIQRLRPRLQLLRGGLRLLAGASVTTGYAWRPRLARTIQRWHEHKPFDAVVTVCAAMLPYARQLQRRHVIDPPAPRHIFDAMDVDSLKWRTFAGEHRGLRRWVYRLEAERVRELEAGRRDLFHVVTLVGDRELERYRRHVSAEQPAMVLRQGVDFERKKPLPFEACDPDRVAFVGVLNYHPNVDGLAWFVREVWPRVRASRPNATFDIVGRDPDARVRRLTDTPGVNLIGPVRETASYLARASLVAAPIRLSFGIQSKVVEAMASQRAVLTTPVAAEGVGATPGESVATATSAAEWAQAAARLLTDRRERESLATRGRSFVERTYSPATCMRPLVELARGRSIEAVVSEAAGSHGRAGPSAGAGGAGGAEGAEGGGSPAGVAGAQASAAREASAAPTTPSLADAA